MDFLSQTYIALRGPTGAPQSPTDTIAKLSDRLSPSTLLADRRAAVLSLKGLTRDCKAEVGERALPGLIQVLQNDAEIDADIGKAVLETVHHLCEVDELSKELGLHHTDYFLANEQPTHTLFALLADSHFYIRYATLQLLATLLQNRRSAVQGYFLKAPKGASSIISVLEDKREIIRNGEANDLFLISKLDFFVPHTDDDTPRKYRHDTTVDFAEPRYPEGPCFRGCFRDALQHCRSRGWRRGWCHHS